MSDLNVFKWSKNCTVGNWGAEYRGSKIPYIEIHDWPHDGRGNQVYLYKGDPSAPRSTVELLPPEFESAPRKWTLTLDHRMAWDFDTKEDLERVLPLVADAMAIAAGWTCHGVANRRNPHGPCITEPTVDDSPAVYDEAIPG